MYRQIISFFVSFSRKLPTYVVNLDLPPEHRWDNIVKSRGKDVRNFFILQYYQCNHFKSSFHLTGDCPDIIGFPGYHRD